MNSGLVSDIHTRTPALESPMVGYFWGLDREEQKTVFVILIVQFMDVMQFLFFINRILWL